MAVAVTGRAASSPSRDQGWGGPGSPGPRSRSAVAGGGGLGRAGGCRPARAAPAAPRACWHDQDREPGRGQDSQGAAQPPAGTQVLQARGPADHPDRCRAGGCQVQPAAGPQVGERLVGGAIAVAAPTSPSFGLGWRITWVSWAWPPMTWSMSWWQSHQTGIPKGGVVALSVHGVGGDDHTGRSRPASSGWNSLISLVAAPTSRWASTAPSS